LTFLGIDYRAIESSIPQKVINQGYSFSLLEVKRLLNYVLTEEDKRLNRDLDLIFQGLSDNATYSNHPLESVLSPKLLSDLKEKFSGSIKKVEQAHNFKLPPEKSSYEADLYSPFTCLKEMVEIITLLKSKHKGLYKKLYSKISDCKWTRLNNDQVRLLELFDFPAHNINHNADAFFSENIIKRMPNYKDVDFFREFASVFIQRGDYKNAEIMINKALEIRPNGPVIKNLKAEIDELLNKRPE
jgi:hypothetical protein